MPNCCYVNVTMVNKTIRHPIMFINEIIDRGRAVILFECYFCPSLTTIGEIALCAQEVLVCDFP